MTKSTITREESIQAVFDLKAGYTLGFADIEILKRVARMALAAMDSEPDCKERKLFCSTDTARMRKVISVSAGTEDAPLYRHAQQPVVPDGYVMVPKEPTEEMLQASYREAAVYSPTAYRAMIAAAPQEGKQ